MTALRDQSTTTGTTGRVWSSLLAAVGGMVAGSSARVWTSSTDPKLMLANRLEDETRWMTFAWGVAVAVVAGGWAWMASRPRDDGAGHGDPHGIRRLTVLLWAVPMLALLDVDDIALARPGLVLLLLTAVGGMAVTLAWHHGKALGRLRAWWPDRTCPVWLAVLMGLAGLHLGRLAIVRHRGLQTNLYDLGIFDNVLWNSLHGDPLGCSVYGTGTYVSEHFAPILLGLVPIYALAPRAETLLLIQVVWLCSGAVPLYLMARRRLGSARYGLLFAFAYLGYPAVHANALWDFHALTLAGPLILWCLWAVESQRTTAYLVCAAALLLVREELALLVMLIGVYVWTTGRRNLGLVTIGCALAYFLMVSLLVAPGAGVPAHAARYAKLLRGSERSLVSLLVNALANPAFVLAHALDEDKVLYLAALLVPVLYTPVAARAILLPGAFGLAFTLLASSRAVYHLYFHYSSLLYPVLLAAAPIGLSRLSNHWGWPRRAFGVGILVASLCSAWVFGAIDPQGSFRAGFKPVEHRLTKDDRTRYRWLKKTVASIPDDASVSASGYLGPHVSARARVYRFPDRIDAEYLLVMPDELRKGPKRVLRGILQGSRYRVVRDEHGIILLRAR